MLPYPTPNVQSFAGAADLSTKQFRFMTGGSTAGQVQTAVAASKVLGVLMNDNCNAAGQGADLAMPGGGAKVILGSGGCAIYDFLQPDANGAGVVSTTQRCAIALAAGSAGDRVPIVVLEPGNAGQAAVVAALAQTISGTYSQSEVQAISTKVDAILTALKNAGLMATA